MQDQPDGLAQAFVIGADHIGTDSVALVLGDNIFYGPGLGTSLSRFQNVSGGAIFAYWVANPSAYGVVEFGADGTALSLEEKPATPKSHYAVPGLYFYDNDVIEIARSLRRRPAASTRSPRSTRPTSNQGRLAVEVLARGTAWLDTGTFDSLLDASDYVRTIERRQGLKISVPEEVAWRVGFIDDDQLAARAHDAAQVWLRRLPAGAAGAVGRRRSTAAIAVVSGTDSASAMPPTAERAISMATLSLVSTSPSDRLATLNSSSSGSALPA